MESAASDARVHVLSEFREAVEHINEEADQQVFISRAGRDADSLRLYSKAIGLIDAVDAETNEHPQGNLLFANHRHPARVREDEYVMVDEESDGCRLSFSRSGLSGDYIFPSGDLYGSGGVGTKGKGLDGLSQQSDVITEAVTLLFSLRGEKGGEERNQDGGGEGRGEKSKPTVEDAAGSEIANGSCANAPRPSVMESTLKPKLKIKSEKNPHLKVPLLTPTTDLLVSYWSFKEDENVGKGGGGLGLGDWGRRSQEATAVRLLCDAMRSAETRKLVLHNLNICRSHKVRDRDRYMTISRLAFPSSELFGRSPLHPRHLVHRVLGARVELYSCRFS